MNREETKKLLPIIQAYSEGKEVQVRDRDDDSWKTWDEYGFDSLRHMDYRIKPEPEVIYVNKRLDGDSFVYDTEEEAKINGSLDHESKEYIAKKFIEVTE